MSLLLWHGNGGLRANYVYLPLDYTSLSDPLSNQLISTRIALTQLGEKVQRGGDGIPRRNGLNMRLILHNHDDRLSGATYLAEILSDGPDVGTHGEIESPP
jgi:hypothetical protein